MTERYFLDAEFLNHAEIFMKYAKASAQASREAKYAEERVKTLRSEIIRDEKRDNPKHTETTLEAAYRNDSEYKEAKAECIEAQFKADLLANAVYAFQARKVALENLVRLHGQEYYSSPKTPHDLPEAAERLNDAKERGTEQRIRRATNR